MLFSSLRREQREAVGLLQIGTFLEYFDLMLYVHMAVLLNDLFFPKTDPHTASLIAAFAFCSTYVLRPFGALLFGWIGDHIGRKTTVIITTMMMAVSCMIMANLPTYSQIGISAAWIVTICRILQGLSSMGEIIGAEIYLTEITKPPASYPIVGLIGCFSALGSMFALIISTLVTSTGFNWRLAFWIGAGIALVGSIARTSLRETPDFVDMKRRMKKAIEESSQDGLGKAADLLKSTNTLFKEKINKNSALACFFIQCAWPVFFYFSYIYCGNILKNKFGYSSEEIINHNLMVSIVQVISFFFFVFLSTRFHPLNLIKLKILMILPFSIISPYIFLCITTPFHLFLIQSFYIFLALHGGAAMPIIINNFPIFKRFTVSSFLYALSRAIVYIITSFGLIYATESFGYSGVLFILIPTIIATAWSVHHFEKMEYKARHSNPETTFKPQKV